MKNIKGFSFIDIGISLLITGIIAVIAIYTYQEHIKEVERQTIWKLLEDMAAQQSIYFRKHRHYTANVCNLNLGIIDCGVEVNSSGGYIYPDMIAEDESSTSKTTHAIYFVLPSQSGTPYTYNWDYMTVSNLASSEDPLPDIHMYQASSHQYKDKECYVLRIDVHGNRMAFDYSGNAKPVEQCS